MCQIYCDGFNHFNKAATWQNNPIKSDQTFHLSVIDANETYLKSHCVQGARLVPVHVKKQNGGQQIKSKNFSNKENKRRVTALIFL